MAAEARQEVTLSAAVVGPASIRRRVGLVWRDNAPPGWPPEIGFLAGQGVNPGVLLKAIETAERAGVSAENGLFAEGFPEDTFYRLLARHLAVPYLERPMRLALLPGHDPWAEGSGLVRLAINARNLDFVLAPRDAGLRTLLRTIGPGQGSSARFAIASPRCLAALVRRHHRTALLRRASHGLRDWDANLSAQAGVTLRQKFAGIACGVLVGLGIAWSLWAALAAATVIVSLLFFAAVLLRLAAATASLMLPVEDHLPIPDRDLPVYTIVVPLHREACIVPDLVAALDALDYPRPKLDIKIMVEANDPETIAALEALRLPSRYDVIVAPVGRPQTKPRALNIGLLYARGAFLVVYDAEDRPEPGQLRAAAQKFRARPARVACLQARLAIDHIEESWLTRMFGLEYEALFHVIKPGLAALGLPIPLGGTSNHFRIAALHRVSAWDAWNVTEDIDLGFRLARFGYRVETLASTTYEEAPLTFRTWLPQRSRWLKGWMVTLAVHTRQPLRLFRELGFWGATSVAASLFGTVLSCLFGPLFFSIVLIQAADGTLLVPETPTEALWSFVSCYLVALGTVSAVWPVVLGLKRRGRLDLAGWTALLPIYLLLVSFASWRAFYEAVGAPYAWNKTEHGLAKRRTGAATAKAT